jgi:hypothetical protein
MADLVIRLRGALGLALVLAAALLSASCDIMALSPFPVTVALAERMLMIKNKLGGSSSNDIRMSILKSGQYLAVVRGNDQLLIFDRDLNLKYEDMVPGRYQGKLAYCSPVSGDFYIGQRVVTANFLTNNASAVADANQHIVYFSGALYYGFRMNGNLLTLESGANPDGVNVVVAGFNYAIPANWRQDGVYRAAFDPALGAYTVVARSTADKPVAVIMRRADAEAGTNPFASSFAQVQEAGQQSENDKGFIGPKSFIYHGNNSTERMEAYVDAGGARISAPKKTMLDTFLRSMPSAYSPDTDRWFAYDPDSGYLYRCKPWW